MRHQRGFNLVELLVGMAISLMGLAAVGTMMMTFSQKRASITQSLAAQDNGVMALYRIERDISQAGYGLMGLQGCASITNGASTLMPYPVAIVTDNLNPSTVSDSITVQYGGGGTGSGVPAAELNSIAAADTYNVKSSAGFALGEYVIATTDCVLRQVSVAPVVGAGVIKFSPTTLASVGSKGYLSDLGNVFVSRQYQVSTANNALQVSEMGAAANNLVDEIIFLKAQYGLAGSVTGTTVSSWADGTNFTIAGTNSKQIIAVRVGVVARSALRESAAIEQPAALTVLPAIVDSGITIGAAATYTVPDTRYRYRAYSTIIPLRNVIWTR